MKQFRYGNGSRTFYWKKVIIGQRFGKQIVTFIRAIKEMQRDLHISNKTGNIDSSYLLPSIIQISSAKTLRYCTFQAKLIDRNIHPNSKNQFWNHQ